MKKSVIFPILFLVLGLQTGCSVTSRLDATNAKMDALVSELQESNRRLAVVEEATAKMAKALP
jgi:hypothetical protein